MLHMLQAFFKLGILVSGLKVKEFSKMPAKLRHFTKSLMIYYRMKSKRAVSSMIIT